MLHLAEKEIISPSLWVPLVGESIVTDGGVPTVTMIKSEQVAPFSSETVMVKV